MVDLLFATQKLCHAVIVALHDEKLDKDRAKLHQKNRESGKE